MIYIRPITIKRIFVSCFAIKRLISYRVIECIGNIDTISAICYLMNLIVISVNKILFLNKFLVFKPINGQIRCVVLGHNPQWIAWYNGYTVMMTITDNFHIGNLPIFI